MKHSSDISSFLEEISHLFHSILFLYLHSIVYNEEGLLMAPSYSLELCIYLSLSPLPLVSLLSSAMCKVSSDIHFAFLNIYFSLGWFRSIISQSVQSLSHIQLFATPWTAARQASLSIPEFTQTHAHRVSDAIQPSHPLLSPSPPAPNPSQHQYLFQ